MRDGAPTLYLIRHPETRVDRSRPPEEWPLSCEGGRQLAALLAQPFWRTVRHVYASPEPKAAVVAQRAGEVHRLPFSRHEELRELTRPGFVADYERMIEDAFAYPEQAAPGWESLTSARARVWTFLREVAARGPLPAAVVSHGLVLSAVRATLLGQRAPRLQDWRRLPFGAVAEVDVAHKRLSSDFSSG